MCADIRRVGTPAGCEIVAHLIRSQLEADPTLVVGKVDCKKCFNEIHKDPIIDVIRDEITALLPFAHLMLTKSPIQTVYHDKHTKVTSVYIMRGGVPQGGSKSSAFFNLGQSRCIRAASRLHPTVSILLISDDTHVLGQLEDVIAAIHTIRQQYADIVHAALHWIPAHEV